MGRLENLKNEKKKVILHKLFFVFRKKFQKIIDISIKQKFFYRDYFLKSVSYKQIRIEELEVTDQKDMYNILNRSFFWLGLNGVSITSDNWNLDFVSGYIWNNDYFQNIVTVDKSNNADVKIPWELSRLQHLSRIACIYNRSRDSKLLKYVIDNLKSWISHNPYKNTVNWTCSMEVAIRAVNMIFIALLIPNELFCDKSFFKLFINSLMHHGMYIRQNLENYDEYNNNHYLSDLLGLQWIGLFCKDFLDNKDKKNVQQWYLFAKKRLLHELKIQIYPDGTDYESSIAYHRYVTELLYLSIYIDRVYDVVPDESIINTVKKMTLFLDSVRLPNGELPMIGDSDDGRIIILDSYSNWDRLKSDYIFEHQEQLLKGKLELPKSRIPCVGSKSISFKNSGYYVLRNDYFYCLTHCGPLSLFGHGGHSHNDQLSVVLAFKGKAFIVDSGTGSYSGNPDLRNFFRSTKAHSTLEVDGLEQNDMRLDNLFMMREKTNSKCLSFNDYSFVGEHYGFKKIGLTHQRRIEISHSELKIVDTVKGDQINNEKKWLINFVLDSNVVAKQFDEHTINLCKENVKVVAISSIPIHCEETIISKMYGSTEKTLRISSSFTIDKNIKTVFVLGGQ